MKGYLLTPLMTKGRAPDYLSDLPSEIIEKVLTLLPIRDAIKTSILSRKWRYRWTSLPCLVFRDEYPTFPEKETINALSKLVTHVLLLHTGPVQKFELFTPYDPNYLNLEQWLLVLSRKDILDLSLKFRDFHWRPVPLPLPVPSCLFSCQLLTHLKLIHCELNLPHAPKGFPCLKSLCLACVSMPQSALEDIVSRCPLLEQFVWVSNVRLDMSIHAPKLKALGIIGSGGELCLEYSPLLARMYIESADKVVERSAVWKFATCNGGLNNLEKLTAVISFIKVLRSSVVYNHLKFIHVNQVSFKDITSVPVVLRLMMRSPHLSELAIDGKCKAEIAAEAANVRSWETICPSDCTFNHLKVVKLTELVGLPEEMKFIEFMLGKSPALKSLVIKPCEHLKEGEGNVLQESVRFRRASESANVSLLQPP